MGIAICILGFKRDLIVLKIMCKSLHVLWQVLKCEMCFFWKVFELGPAFVFGSAD